MARKPGQNRPSFCARVLPESRSRRGLDIRSPACATAVARIHFPGCPFDLLTRPRPARGAPLNGLQAKGKDAELCLVLDNRVDELRRDLVHPSGKSVDQGGITEDIDRAWNSAAGIGDDLACVIGKQLVVRSHSSQPKVDVFADFMSIHGPEMEIR